MGNDIQLWWVISSDIEWYSEW